MGGPLSSLEPGVRDLFAGGNECVVKACLNQTRCRDEPAVMGRSAIRSKFLEGKEYE